MSALSSMYQEIILDHSRHPHGRGLAESFDGEAHHVNPTCGDELTVRVRLDEDRLADVSHAGLGCSISQASASVMTDLLAGRTVAEGLVLHQRFQDLVQGSIEPDDTAEAELGDGIAFAGVARYPMRVKCALLGWMAWKDATARAVSRRSSESNQTGRMSP